MILRPKLKRRQTLQLLQRITASFHFRIFAAARLPLGYNLVVNHEGRDGSDRATGHDGWDFAGHETVVCAAEGEGH